MVNLNAPLTSLPGIGSIFGRKFEKLGVTSIENLFYHVPTRYLDYSQVTKISKLKIGETITIHAKVISIANIISRKGLRMQIGSVEDDTGKVQVLWFNQTYLVRTLFPGKLVSLSGKVSFFNKKICLSSPDFEILEGVDAPTLHTGRLVPIYPETSGLSSKWIRRTILNVIKYPKVNLNDLLPKEILTAKKLVGLKESFQMVHFPENLKEAERGRERLAFNELLFTHLKSLYRKSDWQKNKSQFALKVDTKKVNEFVKSLPFTLTASQKKAIDEILSDLKRNIPMNRLLEGDVGSGKTVVAAIGAYVSYLNGFQTVIMAPTQILAEQHYKTIKKLFPKLKIALVTASRFLIPDSSNIFIGTHALLHSKIDFTNVAFVVIDEQHRFGVEQRTHLVKKSKSPHVLTMTATPIPRTIALTTYGDLDLSVLTDMPKGRLKITTWVVPEKKRSDAYKWINSQITDHYSQCFIVCPLIEESEVETMEGVKAVTQEFESLKKVFGKLKLGLLHGRMKAKEKTQVLNGFRTGKIDILVTTLVVEVGIDIPNATIMVIEAAERFGLAALHQLRGRVGRSDKKSYCLLFTNIGGGNPFRRLKSMEKMHSGFELSELDLKMRGPGEIFGTTQSGFPEFKVASWSNYELIKETRELAEDVIKNPKTYPKLIQNLSQAIHT